MITPEVRLVPLTGAFNFRDLGGYPAAEGTQTRWARLYRSDALHELTDGDVLTLRRLGVSSVIDLRTAAEVQRHGRGLLTSGITYRHLSVLRVEAGESVAAAPSAETDLAERYLWYLETGREAIASAFSAVADSSGHPLVFHCTAGKDRTGVLAAIVLSCLGVSRQHIVDDYMATASRLELIIERLRRSPEYRRQMEGVPATRYQVEAATMERFLDGLDSRHGGAWSWARSAGVSDDALANLKAGLLEPAPGKQ